MASQLFSTFTEVGLVDTRVNAGTITLPKTIDIPYRQISLKDIYGNFQNKTLTLNTQFPDTFEDATTTKVLSNAFGFTTLYAGGNNVWYTVGGTVLTSQTVSSLTVSSIIGNGGNLVNLPAISSLSLQSTVAGLGQNYISTASLISTTVALQTAGFVSAPNLLGHVSTSTLNLSLTSTVAALTYGYQTAGFISTPTIQSTTAGLLYSYQTAGFISTPTIQSTTAGLLYSYQTAGFISTPTIQSTTAGLLYSYQTAGFISTPTIQSTTAGLLYSYQTAGFVSAPNLVNHVSTTFLNTTLQSTTAGLGQMYVSSFSSFSTLLGLSTSISTLTTQYLTGTQAFISSLIVNSLSLGSNTSFIDMGDIIAASLSTTQINTAVLYAGAIYTSSIQASTFVGALVTSNLTSTVASVTYGYQSAGFISTATIQSTTAGITYAFQTAGFLSTATLQSTVAGLGQIYVSTVAAAVSQSNITSTIQGLGTFGYISSTQLLSSTRGYATAFTSLSASFSSVTASNLYVSTLIVDNLQLGSGDGWYDFGPLRAQAISSIQINTGILFASSINAFQVSGATTTLNLVSTTQGLQYSYQTAGFVSTANLLGHVSTTYLTTTLQSTVTGVTYGYQTSGFLSTTTLQSTVAGLGQTYVSSTQLLSTTTGIYTYISSFIDPTELTSTVVGLGTTGYVSTMGLLSTASGLASYITTFIDPVELASTVAGLGSASFISSLQLQLNITSTVAGLGTVGYISAANLLGHVSTSTLTISLTSTVQGLGSATYISSAHLASTIAGLGSSSYISSSQLTSTITGLASSSYISSSQLTSTVTGLGLIYISTLALTSTVQGLGSATYVSTGHIISTGVSYSNYFTSLSAGFSTIFASNGYISSLRVDSLQLGSGDGWADFGPLRAAGISTLQLNAGAVYATSNFVGSVSTPFNAIQFYGLFGQYNNTVLAEVSTGVGTQELLFFKGSSASDRIRLQTTGNIVFEPGSSARLWASSITSNVTPAMIINTSSNVGIQTASPQTTLDVAGTGRFQIASTLAMNVSTVNGFIPWQPSYLTSTVVGVTYGYQTSGFISTATIQSTTLGLQMSGFISTPTIQSTTAGLLYAYQTAGFISTPTIQSTTAGLLYAYQTAGFISTPTIQSTTAGLLYAYQTAGFISTPTIQSTTAGIFYAYQTAGFVSTPTIQSTTAGLLYAYQNAGFISTATIQSTTAGLLYAYQTAGFISAPNLLNHVSTTFLNTTLQSTTAGLGQIYVSTVAAAISLSNLTSTVVGLGTIGYVSSFSTFSTLIGLSTSISTLTSQYIYGAQGFISSLTVNSLYLGATSGFIDLGDMIATTISTGQLNATIIYASSIQALQISGATTTGNLVSTTAGITIAYQRSGFISTATIQSTTLGLQMSGFLSTPTLFSTTLGLQMSGFISTPTIQSTTLGLQMSGFISTATIQSTTLGLQMSGFVSAPNLIGHVSTTFLNTTLQSTGTSYATYFTTLSAGFSSVTASNVFASTLIVNNLQIGTGLGWVNIGPLQTVALSTTQVQAGSVYATSNFIGSVSTPYSAVQFYGLLGQYNNTVLSEVSTGVGTQELLLFKGSSTSDRIRLQTTGNIIFEPGSSARLWASSITSNVVPAMIINTSSNVGIGTASPQTTLDVAGTGRFQTVSTLGLNISSINGQPYSAAAFTGSSISLSTASLFTSSVQASSISVGGGAWLSNTGLYLSNAQAGGAVGQLITNSGFVKLVAASGWSGGYTGFAITGGDLVNKIYMTAGPNAIGGQIAIGGTSPSPGSGISLDVFGVGRFSSISTFQTAASSIGIGTGQPLTPLDVAGMGRFQQLSTLSFNVSSINGFIPWQPSYLQSTVQGLGTAGYISTAGVTQSNVTSSINSLLIPYSTLNTDTYFQVKASSTQLYYGNVGSTAQIYVGDVQAANGNTTATNPLLLMEQLPIPLPTVTSNYSYTGSDQTFTVPAGVTALNVVLNGAAGGAPYSGSTLAGAGGYVSGTLAVTPGQSLTIMVGKGGAAGNGSASSNSYGGGGAGGVFSGVGGGRSAIISGGSDLVTAGGGGGAGSSSYGGGAGGGTTGATGGGGANGGAGGTQSAGGVSPANNATPWNGALGQGGYYSSPYGGYGGGGGGYYGGAVGGYNGGGGGGSSYVSNLTGTVVNTQGGGAAAVYYAAGGNGSITITYTPAPNYRPGNLLEIRNYLLNKTIIDPNLNMGINVSSITSGFQFDVNGASRAVSMSTQTIQVSSINGVIGINASTSALTLDVNGIGRMGMPVSSITGSVATFGTASYGIYYYISNSAFSNITLTSVTAFTGWFVTLRNNTGTTLSVTVTGQTNSTPASPFSIAASNATTIAYDTNYNSGGTAGYAFF